jgi:eukaryotic-like serine/threonine-protein kinase
MVMTAPDFRELVLPPDVIVAPVAELALDVRAEIDCADDACAVTRPRSRGNSTVVGAELAALLERFREPATIIDAVLEFSRNAGLDPMLTLERSFESISQCIADGLLVVAGSDAADAIVGSLENGDEVAGLTIVAPVQVLLDTEVYLVRDRDRDAHSDSERCALKLARPGHEHAIGERIAHEARILSLLDGACAPRLQGTGEHDGRPFLALGWCDGVDVATAAAELRGLAAGLGRDRLLGLCQTVLDAYAVLHDHGVLHGDVHPRNLLVDDDGSVTIIDFGLSTSGADATAIPRGGVDLFMEPELACARRDGVRAPALDAGAEQYSVAALLVLLLTGSHTHDFALEPEAMLRQLICDRPRSLTERGVTDLPFVQHALERALRKDPRARHSSMRRFAVAFAAAACGDRDRATARPDVPIRSRAAGALLKATLERLAIGGALQRQGLRAPTASAANGAAGCAYALLRIAAIRGDAELLALADMWSTRALAQARSGADAAFFDPVIGIDRERFGVPSLFHGIAGVHAVHALVASARGDQRTTGDAVQAFVQAASAPTDDPELIFGAAGLLNGCTMLREQLAPGEAQHAVACAGDELYERLTSWIAADAAAGDEQRLALLGAAHGHAGILFATLRWCELTARPARPALIERLGAVAALSERHGRGLRWPDTIGATAAANQLSASWCNGAAGMVALWTLAARLTGDQNFDTLARGAAWTACEDRRGHDDICCGYAGRGYALLELHRHTGDPIWLARAAALADRAAVSARPDARQPDSLHKGALGVALLAAELDDPLGARLPLYG